MTRWLIVAAVGAVVCTVCDHLHAAYGATAYANPALWDQAWWVPLLFGVAVPLVVFLAGPVRRVCGGAALPVPSAREIAGDGILFVTAYALTAFSHQQGLHLNHRDVLGVPYWLPTLYMHGALLAAPLQRLLAGDVS